MANSVQTALNTRAIKSYRWANTAARNAQAGMAAGDVGYQIDDGTNWQYSGTAWLIVASPGDPGIPFAQAAGVVTIPAAQTTITLPAGRFTVAPVITAAGASSSAVTIVRIRSTTTTSFEAAAYNVYAGDAGGGLYGESIAWSAIQMTSGSASG